MRFQCLFIFITLLDLKIRFLLNILCRLQGELITEHYNESNFSSYMSDKGSEFKNVLGTRC